MQRLSMQKDDLIRVHHMLEASCEAVSFIHGRTRTDLESNRMLTLSIVKSFDIDLDRVWDTVTDDLPPLIIALKKIVEAG